MSDNNGLYCSKCGAHMIAKQSTGMGFDTRTGTQNNAVYLECPNFRKSQIWIGTCHDTNDPKLNISHCGT